MKRAFGGFRRSNLRKSAGCRAPRKVCSRATVAIPKAFSLEAATRTFHPVRVSGKPMKGVARNDTICGFFVLSCVGRSQQALCGLRRLIRPQNGPGRHEKACKTKPIRRPGSIQGNSKGGWTDEK